MGYVLKSFGALVVIGAIATGMGRREESRLTFGEVSNTNTKPSRCFARDFKLTGVTARIEDRCSYSSCPYISITGDIKNTCALPAGAQVKITARNADGRVVRSWEFWPASIRNIAPGASYALDFSHEEYNPVMATFETGIIDAHTWR